MSTEVSVITGGAGGMGLATAKLLGKGRHLVITDVDAARLETAAGELRALGFACTPVVCDITARASVDALIDQAAAIGRVASVVHAAGVSPQMGAPEFIVRINALGTVYVAEACLRVASEGFALVNVASIAGHLLPGFLAPHRAYRLALTDAAAFEQKLISAARRAPAKLRAGQAYSLSKNFVIWYSKAMAARFGERGARIVSVSPGSFDTAMGRLEEKSGAGALLEYAALKRFGRPEEVAELLAFCASSGPGYLTGVDILCDGGTLAGMGFREMLKLALNAR